MQEATAGKPMFRIKVIPSQAKVLTEGGDLREGQINVTPSGSHSCV
jgi:hypothetical protein